MDLRTANDSESRFVGYVEGLVSVIGHADRAGPLRDYCVGLMLPCERKSVEPMAAVTAPERTAAQHQSLLHFVGNAGWSDERVLAKVREMVLPEVERHGPIEAWIIDDTGFPKQGRHSVGVARQYCGQLGKQDNCQVAVSLSVANHHASLPVAYRLYLPQDWAQDRKRRCKAGVPEEISFKTKPEIALEQLRWACEAGLQSQRRDIRTLMRRDGKPVLFGLWVTNLAAFNGDALRELAAQFLALSERQGAAIQLMIGHRLMGTSLLHAGDFAQCRSHFDRAITLYDPATHRPLAARFGQDSGVAILCYRSWAQWILGYPEASLADADRALRYAQEIDHAPTLMFALTHLSITYILCRKDEAATASLNQIVALADGKGALFWKNGSIMLQGRVLSLNGEAAAAVKMITSVIAAARSTGATMWLPLYLLHLGNAYGHLGEYDEAWGFIGEAMTTIEATKERWWKSELNRTAGELALKSRGANAEEYFDRALVIARQQQAKSWELRAAMSMARLWREQGKWDEARELLAPVYGGFTEGFDTRDLKEARNLLDELNA